MVDLLISNGTVIDGAGTPGFRASVAVTGDTIQIIPGDVSAVAASRTIDATGYVVCPGFIDMHSHSDLRLLTDPAHEAKIRQGVTTELWEWMDCPTRPPLPAGWSNCWFTWQR